jgi:hypothetical protein
MAERVASLMEPVLASPELVGRHQREAWLALFAGSAVIEDPVGLPPHRRHGGELEAFWETYIAPNQIRFEVLLSVVADPLVVRDVVIHTRLRGGARTVVPARLLYELVDEEGALKIRRMAAHWDLSRAMLGTLGSGWAGLRAALAQSWRILRRQGPGRFLGFFGGALGALLRGPGRSFARFRRAVDTRDPELLARLLAGGGRALLHPGERELSPPEVLESLPPHSCVAPVRSGPTVSFRLDGEAAGRGPGIGLLEPARGGRVRRLRLFAGQPP